MSYLKEDQMTNWQQRVKDEEIHLEEKLLRLKTFIYEGAAFAALPPVEQARLHRQIAHMRDYLAVLKERVAAFSESKQA